jgi:tetratricopeptide (TPR) repeat protein
MGDVVAYKQPDTALHHLKMAKSYLDEADKQGEQDKKPNRVLSDAQINILAQAAHHLNKAREIDPSELLWIEEKNEKIKLDQDTLNGDVLLSEGVAHLNAAVFISNTFGNIDGTFNKGHYKAGVSRLEQARDALEKAIKYRPYSDQTYKFLAQVYGALGDIHNYRRILERHVEISPDNIEVHKQLAALANLKYPSTRFRQKPFSLSVPTMLSLSFLAGIILIIVAIASHNFNPAGFGIILLIASGIGFKIYET